MALARGLVEGGATVLGGLGQTLAFLLTHVQLGLSVASVVVVLELLVISWLRFHYFTEAAAHSVVHVVPGRALVFVAGALIGSSGGGRWMHETTVRARPVAAAAAVLTTGTQYGPLIWFLLAMTVVTGLVDAFSYLALGHVFVANMTGNVVFLGFALAGAPYFSIADSVVALVAFALGALAGGRLAAQLKHHRGRHLSTATSIQAAFLAASAVPVLLGGSAIPGGYHAALIVLLGIAMGIQNATARALAVPDMTTTVLTLTLTALAADIPAGGPGSSASRRLLSVAAMLAGALIGAALLMNLHAVSPLLLAVVLALLVGLLARVLGAANPAWVYPKP